MLTSISRYTRLHFTDVNIRLTIELAAFFIFQCITRRSDSNGIASLLPLSSSRSFGSLSSPLALLFRRLFANGVGREKRPRIADVSTARIARAPADRKLPLIAWQTFILHPECPYRLLPFVPPPLRVRCLLIKFLSIKLNRIPLYHPPRDLNEHDSRKQTPLYHVQRD